jgi:hypothetical protein
VTQDDTILLAKKIAAYLDTPEGKAAMEKAAAQTRETIRRLEEACRMPPDFHLRRVTI